MVLAAAILLRIKSKRLVGKDLEELDRLIASREEEDVDGFYEDLDYDHSEAILEEEGQPELIPRTPQPRIRKVSVYDLVGALEQALEVKRRRVLSSIPETTLEIPRRAVNVSRSIKNIYRSILDIFGRKERVTFSRLLPESPSKEAKVFTFIPLLHLANTKKIGLEQKEHFGEIDIFLRSERIVGEDPMKDYTPEYVQEEKKAEEEKAKKRAKSGHPPKGSASSDKPLPEKPSTAS
jgi:chromatin segregation and condensation protein Rec8/ScpA/Scc1 (kleisin family)